MKWVVAVAVMALAGCAGPSSETIEALRHETRLCQEGLPFACDKIAGLRSQAQFEAQMSQRQADNSIALIGLGAAMMQGPPRVTPTQTTCHRMGAFVNCTTN